MEALGDLAPLPFLICQPEAPLDEAPLDLRLSRASSTLSGRRDRRRGPGAGSGGRVLQFLNRVGIRAYEKAGFRPIGRRRESRVMGSEVYDEI